MAACNPLNDGIATRVSIAGHSSIGIGRVSCGMWCRDAVEMPGL
jgi:hypothetical protein